LTIVVLAGSVLGMKETSYRIQKEMWAGMWAHVRTFDPEEQIQAVLYLNKAREDNPNTRYRVVRDVTDTEVLDW
jgi:hypothetical protein